MLLGAMMMFMILVCPFSCFADEEQEPRSEEQEIMRGVMSSFSLPLRDLLKKEHPSEWENLFHGFSGSFAFNYPLREKKAGRSTGSGSQGEVGTSMTANATLKYNPLSYWFLQTTFYVYMHPEDRAPWNPDFTYVFGYDDWHPYTFSLVYSNYTGNHFSPDKKDDESFSNFEEGTVSLGWKYVLPRFLEELFIVHSSGGVAGGIYYNVTPRYVDQDLPGRREWKQSLSFTMKYTIYKWLYANCTLYYYPDPSQQQPWDPDFTYGFGYFDWHPGTFSIQYNNYSGNRYPWHKASPGTGTFEDGSISASYSWAW
jgi:hypothetical protein